MAKFKINIVFKITGRGHVLSGNIIDGEISSGDLVQLVLDGKMRQLMIRSVESIDHSTEIAEIGLILGPLENNIVSFLEAMKDQTVSIIKAEKI
jgi:GTPase